MNEDAFINLRILDQIFAGNGPVFNAGERVEAATSPLWLGVLVVVRFLFSWSASMEWLTLLASLAAAVTAFVVAGLAMRRVHRDEAGMIVPVGLLLVAGVAAVWDFSTSGLEIGLVWLWIASVWYIVVDAAQSSSEPRTGARIIGCVVIGLAPLIRPDLGVMMLTFIVAWFVLVRPRRILLDLTAFFAVPVAYQVFRMGYYATLVPTTALAKDAGGVHFGQGWEYLRDFADTYWLWVTALLIGATIVLRSLRQDRRMAIATVAMLVAAFAHALYMTRAGGDYMHGRLLLPSFFAFAIPASVSVELAASRARAIASTALAVAAVAWLVVTAGAFRPRHVESLGLFDRVLDWRTVSGAKVKPDDFAFGLSGFEAADEYERGVRGYFQILDETPRPALDPDAFVMTLGSIGVPAYNAGREIWVIDIGGLAEPLAARTAPIPGRIAGHRKQLDTAWYDARFGAEPGGPEVDAARRALACDPGEGLLDAVTADLTPGRFLSNMWRSLEFTTMRVPSGPRIAEREWCRE
jgi:arabinofuranosyltransferase